MNSEVLTQMVRDLPRVWRDLGRTRQTVFGGVAAAIVLGLIGLGVYFQRPQSSALYTNLNDQDAAAIVAKLKELKVPYTVADGGATILVPREQSSDVRLQLAGQGLPSGNGATLAGMELFDKSNLGITDFAQKLNYQRGLEGELTRTIGRLSAIETVRVHLVLPQDRLFTAAQKDPTSSVVLKLRPGAKLSDDQVASIKFLVSKGVEGLKPENVAVVDVNGNTLGKLDSPQGMLDKQASTRMELQRQRETEMERKIQGLLDEVLGPNHAVVRASVALDWNQVERKLETFSPANTQPQRRSEHDVRENFQGTGAAMNPAVGVPGTQANIPTYQGAADGQNSNYQRSDVTTNFEVSSDKQNIIVAPGDVKNVSIAVMVDQAVQAAQEAQILRVVTAAAGIQAQRGDQVEVVALPFDNSLATQLKKQQEEQRNMEIWQMGTRILGLVVAMAGIIFLFLNLTKMVRPKEQKALPVAEPVALLGGAAALLPPMLVQRQLEEATEWAVPLDRELVVADLRKEFETEYQSRRQELERVAEDRRVAEEERRRAEEVVRKVQKAGDQQDQSDADAAERQRVRESVLQMALAKPDALAEVLSTWLADGKKAQAAQMAGGR